MAEGFKKTGLRVTPQRWAVWSAFGEQENSHLTADEIFRRARRELPELSRATVYNTLAAFVDAGLLRAIQGQGAVLYDPNTDPDHHHFRCRVCDRLYDIHIDGVKGLRVSGDSRFAVEHRTVLLSGLCPSCSRAGKIWES